MARIVDNDTRWWHHLVLAVVVACAYLVVFIACALLVLVGLGLLVTGWRALTWILP